MNTVFWVILIVVGIVTVAVALTAMRMRKTRRRRELQDRFLAEYDRTVRTVGDRDAAERELQQRIDRRNVVQLHDIDARRRYAIPDEWIAVQASFVDDPARAISRAARLVHDAMSARGYPDENT